MNTWFKNNGPYLMAGFGLAGMYTAIGLAVKATPKADNDLRERRKELGVDKLPTKEILKIAWRNYWPTVLVSSLSGGAVVGGVYCLGRTVHNQNALLGTMTSALTASEGVSKALEEKVVEKLGKEKTEEVKKEAIKEVHVDDIIPNDIFAAKRPGEETYMEPWTGQMFNLNPLDFANAKNVLNDRLYQSLDGEVSLRDLFYEWGMKHAEIGDMYVFIQDEGMVDYDTIPASDRYGRAYQIVNYLSKPRLSR